MLLPQIHDYQRVQPPGRIMWSAKAGGAASVEPRPDGSPAVPQYYQGGGAVPAEFHEMPHSEGAS